VQKAPAPMQAETEPSRNAQPPLIRRFAPPSPAKSGRRVTPRHRAHSAPAPPPLRRRGRGRRARRPSRGRRTRRPAAARPSPACGRRCQRSRQMRRPARRRAPLWTKTQLSTGYGEIVRFFYCVFLAGGRAERDGSVELRRARPIEPSKPPRPCVQAEWEPSRSARPPLIPLASLGTFSRKGRRVHAPPRA